MSTASARPWLSALEAAPADEIIALLSGYAEVSPHRTAEPADAAATLLADAPEATLHAFDIGCSAALDTLSNDLLAGGPHFDRTALLLDRLFAVVRRLRPADTVNRLHRGPSQWIAKFEIAAIDDRLDLRREVLRTLAVTQDAAADIGKTHQPLWLDVCSEAGVRGRYTLSYLDVGLLGLARMPLGPDESSHERFVCMGFARWIERQTPKDSLIVSRWREIESAFPRAASYWPPLIDAVLDTFESAGRRTPAFEALRGELDLPLIPDPARRPSPALQLWDRASNIKETDAVVGKITTNRPGARQDVASLIAKHRQYATNTGDWHDFVQVSCRLGSTLLKHEPRGQTQSFIAELATGALEAEPHNPYAWSLWRNAMRESGALGSAKTIGWETVLRFPDDAGMRSQLANLLAFSGDDAIAEALFKETIDVFVADQVARADYARFLSQRERWDEAVAMLKEAIRYTPDNPHSYTQLAVIHYSVERDTKAALALLETLQQRVPNDTFATRMKEDMERGARITPPKLVRHEGDVRDVPVELPTSRWREHLFMAELGSVADRDASRELLIRQPVADSPAYGAFVKTRLGLEAPSWKETVFAIAFEEAARSGSAGALDALMAHASANEALIINLAKFVRGEAALPAPPTNDNQRFVRIGALLGNLGHAVEAKTDASLRRLISDMAANELSIPLAA